MSQNIKDIIIELVKFLNDTKLVINSEDDLCIIHIIDVSGSTGNIYIDETNILTKEGEVMLSNILDNIDATHYCISFHDTPKNHGKINILKEEGLVDIPYLKPLNSTYTANAFNMAVDILNDIKHKKIMINLYTDGKTNNVINDFSKSIKIFDEKKIDLHIFAVSDSYKNLEKISINEEKKIPGMDLVNMLKNSTSSLTIYNRYHSTLPYTGSLNSKINKDYITLLGVPINNNIIDFFHDLINKIEEKDEITWGLNHTDLKKLLTDIGKTFSLIFINFPDNNPFIIDISKRLSILIDSFTPERIINIIKYGFECTKNNSPIIFTNFDEHVIDVSTKQKSFSNANELLEKHGTILESLKCISIPYGLNQMCIISEMQKDFNKKLGKFPNSMDEFGNVYFGIDANNDQACRQGLRELCNLAGFQNAKFAPDVIFYILHTMSLMFLSNIDLDCEHMQELRKLAIIQTSMTVLIKDKTHHEKGCYFHWKEGRSIAMHYSKPNITHSSLFTNKLINKFELNEPLWWALMMTMLDIFDEQLFCYKTVLEELNIIPTKDGFLEWFKSNYSISNEYKLFTFELPQKSVISLDHFDFNNPNDLIFQLNDHENCRTKTWYTESQLRDYVLKPRGRGCVWCRYDPKDEDLTLITINPDNWKEQIKESRNNNFHENEKITNSIFNSGLKLQKGNEIKVRIVLVGTVGSGKSTIAKKIREKLINKNIECLIVSSDKWNLLGYKGENLRRQIFNEMSNFDRLSNNKKVIIMDLCNERGQNKNSFGFNTSEYKDIIYYPNFNKEKFHEYDCWSLTNILSRDGNNDYLNPSKSGSNTCISVLNMKSNSIANLLGISRNNFNENLDIDEILTSIKKNNDNYKLYLSNIDLDSEINKLLIDI